MTKFKIKSVGALLILLLLVCLAFIAFTLFPNVKTKVFRTFAKGTFYLTTEADTLYSLGFYGIRKFDVSNLNSIRLLASSDNICKDFKIGRSATIKGNYIYVVSRSYWGGLQEEAKPKERFRFEDNISDFSKNKSVFDGFKQSKYIKMDELGKPNFNFGCHSLRTVSINESGFIGSSYLIKKIDPSENSNVSFWLNVDSLNMDCVIPVLGLNGETKVGLLLQKAQTGYYTVKLSEDNGKLIRHTNFQCKDWFQFKLGCNEGKVSLFWRTKECGKWIGLDQIILSKTELNELQIGLCTKYGGTQVLIDDYYYDYRNLDECSYINGALTVYRKSDLKPLKTLYSDIKLINSKIHDNFLIVSGLYGFNIYDLARPENPQLIYTYRHPHFKEFQGVDIYTHNGKTYAVFAMFAEGLSIWDITNTADVKCVYTHFLNEKMSDGTFLSNGLQSFDVLVDYPYAYATVGPMKGTQGTQNDKKGMIVYNLKDLHNITTSFVDIPKKYWYSRTTSDGQPTCVIKYKESLYLNWGNDGALQFDISCPSSPKYVRKINIAGDKLLSPMTISNRGVLYAGSTYWGDIYNITLK